MELLKKFASEIKNNYGTLIIAFLLSVLFWLIVSVQVFPTIQDKVNDITIVAEPTDYMNEKNLRIVSEFEDIVDIRIEGKRYDISDLSAEDFIASVDLSSVKSAGTYTVPVDVILDVDAECTILDASPSSVTLVIDEIVSREFPIKGTAPNISLPEGYYVDEITTSPDVVTVTGSASVLDKITSIEARSTFNGEIRESHETQSTILIYGSNGSKIINSDLKLSNENVSVNIPIYKQKELQLKFTYTNVPANFDIDSLKYTINPPSITVAAPDDSIDYLNELNIGAIDISDIRLNQVNPIPITLPDGYKNLSGNNSARITWDISDYSKMDFTVSNITLTNVPENFDVSLITKEITFTVIGPSEDLGILTANDLLVNVNLLGVSLRDGSQDVPVSVTIRGNKQTCWISGGYKATIYADEKAEQEE